MIEFFPGRSENSIKNRFYSNLRQMRKIRDKGKPDMDRPDNLKLKVDRHKTLFTMDEFLLLKERHNMLRRELESTKPETLFEDFNRNNDEYSE